MISISTPGLIDASGCSADALQIPGRTTAGLGAAGAVPGVPLDGTGPGSNQRPL